MVLEEVKVPVMARNVSLLDYGKSSHGETFSESCCILLECETCQMTRLQSYQVYSYFRKIIY